MEFAATEAKSACADWEGDRCYNSLRINPRSSEVKMVALLNKPSSLIHEICIEKVGTWNLFKFSEWLQCRMEELLEKKKSDLLTPEEMGELDRIFTHINATIAAQQFN